MISELPCFFFILEYLQFPHSGSFVVDNRVFCHFQFLASLLILGCLRFLNSGIFVVDTTVGCLRLQKSLGLLNNKHWNRGLGISLTQGQPTHEVTRLEIKK